MPKMLERFLVNENFNIGVGHRPAKIIISLYRGLDRITKPKGFLFSIFLRRLHVHFELRQLIFFKPEQCRAANFVVAAFVPKCHPVFAQRHFVGQIKRTPCASKFV